MKNYHIKSFEKIISVLRLFSVEKPSLSFKEISATNPSADKTMLYRTLANLCEQDLLVKDLSNQKYKLGPLVLRLGFVAWKNFELKDITTPILREVASKTGQTVHLSQKLGSEIFYLERIEGGESLTVKSREGMTRPIYSTASGKVLAAYVDEEELSRLLDAVNFKPLTKYTIRDRKALIDQLKETRKRGYATDNREHNIDVSCVAAPVWGISQKVIAAISISGPYFYFDSRSIPIFARDAKHAAQEIHSEIERRGITI